MNPAGELDPREEYLKDTILYFSSALQAQFPTSKMVVLRLATTLVFLLMAPRGAIAFSRIGLFIPKSVSRATTTSVAASSSDKKWEGGFAESKPEFAYPQILPDLSSLPMLENMANIDKLDRMQKVLWPEFSWETKPGDPSSRCFQMFAPDISRIGYTTKGRVYSIICPQKGFNSPVWGNLNVEITVTGQRGWVDETDWTIAADMSVVVQVWFSKSARQYKVTQTLEKLFRLLNLGKPLPFSKEDAIQITAYDRRRGPGCPTFPLMNGTSIFFNSPPFATHWDEAYGVAHLQAEVGPVVKREVAVVDDFNQAIVNVFNRAGGNLVQYGNVLAWDVWFDKPEIVNQTEWANHAEKWRQSLEADHGSPEGKGTEPRFFNGDLFLPFWPLNISVLGAADTDDEDAEEATRKEIHKKADVDEILQLLDKYGRPGDQNDGIYSDDVMEEVEETSEELRKLLEDL